MECKQSPLPPATTPLNLNAVTCSNTAVVTGGSSNDEKFGGICVVLHLADPIPAWLYSDLHSIASSSKVGAVPCTHVLPLAWSSVPSTTPNLLA